MCVCRSDPLLQRQKVSSGSEGAEKRHTTTSSEPHAQAPGRANVPYYQMIDVPPSDYVAKPLTVDKVCFVVTIAVTSLDVL